MNIDYFGNDKYRVLSCMATRQISVKDSAVIKLSQQEIADILQLSKVKVNAIISELKLDGYLTQKSPRGKYSLTVKSVTALAEMNGKAVTK
jgi:DNA-binding IclR family transcriptional regulator